MRVIVTLGDLFDLGVLAILIAISIVLLLVAFIDVKTKDWRYRHFKCPKCKNRRNGDCNHFRNSGTDCDYFVKK